MANHTSSDKYTLQVKTKLVGWSDVAVKVTYETAAAVLAECPNGKQHRIYNKTRRAVLM